MIALEYCNTYAAPLGNGNASNWSQTRIIRLTRPRPGELGTSEIPTTGASTAGPTQIMSNATVSCNWGATPRPQRTRLQRWTCQIPESLCRRGFITSVWLRTRELQRWTSGPSKSECTPANVCRASQLQRDDVCANGPEPDTVTPICALRTHFRSTRIVAFAKNTIALRPATTRRRVPESQPFQ